MSLVAFACIIYALMSWVFKQENRKREHGMRDSVMEGLTEDEILALGDENPRFVFAR